MRNRLARKMAAEMREATCAGTQTSKAPTLSGPSVTNHYSVPRWLKREPTLPQAPLVKYFKMADHGGRFEDLPSDVTRGLFLFQ